MSDSIKLGNHLVGAGHPPYIIAEMSGNHNQSLDRALEIVEAAAKTGAQALKLQTYTADTMTIDINEGEFFISDESSLWKGKSLYELYQMAHTPWEWHLPIMEKCKELGIDCISTPFDETAVDFLEELNVPYYKIASFENTDLPLIRKVASTGKPIIISTGMASLAEIEDMVKCAREAGCNDLIILKCTSSYPATPESTNLRTIPHLQSMFDVQVGLSDHSMGVGVSVASVALGASVIEKHFTLDRSEGGVDSAFSLEPLEFKALCEESLKAWQGLGKVSYGVTEKEKNSLVFRRSIYITEDMIAGEEFSNENTRRIRPGLGMAPKMFDQILGKKASVDIKRGTPLSEKLINYN
jgi:pseudaminic acid synthase